MTKFQSRLADKIILFLEFKHSIGIIYKTGEWTLCDFDRYNLKHGNYGYLEKETVEGWIHHKKERSNLNIWVICHINIWVICHILEN